MCSVAEHQQTMNDTIIPPTPPQFKQQQLSLFLFSSQVQRVVRPILECVERHTGFGRTSSRGIAFSSFDPDVCVALKAHERNMYPVLYLSECGASPHADVRRTSIEAAIQHAVSTGLAGE